MGFDIILCEGDSDSVLIGYYLTKAKDWKYLYKPDAHNLPNIASNLLSSTGSWFTKDGRYLLIWAVNGNDFRKPLDLILEYNSIVQVQDHSFINICILTDHDDHRTEGYLINDITDSCLSYSICFTEQLRCNVWLDTLPIKYGFSPTTITLSFFLTIIPDNEEGTLESFLLNCCSCQDSADKKIITQCNSFVDSIDCTIENPPGTFSQKYLRKRGDRPKAKFSVFFSIVNPRKVFCSGNELLLSVPWEKYSEFNEFFSVLIERL